MSLASLIALALVILSGCHRMYDIRGEVVVSPGAVARAGVPALVCTGHGGPLETSGVYGGRASRLSSIGATLFCAPPAAPVSFVLYESIYYGWLPR
jgi:hypothetical protein